MQDVFTPSSSLVIAPLRSRAAQQRTNGDC